MKNKWKNYAFKDWEIKSSYIREYIKRKKVRKTRETSDCNSIIESRKIEKEIKDHYESIRKEDVSKTHQEGRQGISCSDQGWCEVEERDIKIQNGEKKMKKEKVSPKEKKHEARESKAFEKKEDKKESKGKKK